MANWLISNKVRGAVCAMGAVLGMSCAAMAADLPTAKEPIPVAPPVADYQPYFVKLGVTFAVNTSNSTLYGPLASRVARGDLGTYPQYVGGTLNNIVTAGFEGGIFVTPNVSINISGGIPVYVGTRTKGFNPVNPPLLNGTLLGEAQLAIVPMTVVYHFNQFGAFQPYLGGGIAPGFSFGNRNAFLTGITVQSSVGAVAQGGADYMIDRHWGVSFDVKKVFAYSDTNASGVALLPGVPAYSVLHTRFQPWLFSAGVVYRFGGPEAAVVAKY